MFRRLLVLGAVLALPGPPWLAENAGLTAAQIVNKNVAARGGLKAWRAVQTITESGKMGAGGDQREPQAAQTGQAPRKTGCAHAHEPAPGAGGPAPLYAELERPRRMRLEIQFKGQTAVQVYDGTNGWKVRPFLNRMEVENYTEDELRKAALQSDLDGPLVDYAAKGTTVELEGTDKVEDKDNYRLKLTMSDGHVVHVWIDAKTFLETKIEGTPRRLDGLEHPVEVYFRDYRNVDGLQIPVRPGDQGSAHCEAGQGRAPVEFPGGEDRDRKGAGESEARCFAVYQARDRDGDCWPSRTSSGSADFGQVRLAAECTEDACASSRARTTVELLLTGRPGILCSGKRRPSGFAPRADTARALGGQRGQAAQVVWMVLKIQVHVRNTQPMVCPTRVSSLGDEMDWGRLPYHVDLYREGGAWKFRVNENLFNVRGFKEHSWREPIHIGPAVGPERLTRKEAQRVVWEKLPLGPQPNRRLRPLG